MSVFKKIAASVLSLELLVGCQQPQQQAMHVVGNENETSQIVDVQIVENRPAINIGSATPVQRLVVNEENYCTVRYAGEQQGIEELCRLSRTSLTEEAWIYLPQFNVWIEVGKQILLARVNQYGAAFDMKVDDARLLEIVEQNKSVDEIQLWHIHPCSRMVADAALQQLINEGTYVSEETRKKEYFYAWLEFAMPSIGDYDRDGIVDGDFRVYAHLYKMLSKVRQGINFSAGICSDSGVLRFSFTHNGFSRYVNMKTAEIMHEVGEQNSSISWFEPPESLFWENDEKIKEYRNSVIADFCRQMCTPYFMMTFVPH